MNYLIIHDDTPIGRIVEPVADHSMGVVQGPFVPFQAYERVRLSSASLPRLRRQAPRTRQKSSPTIMGSLMRYISR